mmetsp:Transcript_20805/g.41379  ORF Transcript_20805/g.41379 Transcript_20805/m.41379 type:complete len:568 (+) Transcript_20805:36-1739(+)
MDVETNRQRAMERRDFGYYEARNRGCYRDVKSKDITSCKGNASILQRLRASLQVLDISDHHVYNHFVVGEGDDLGWLGYFIGKSKYLYDLRITSWGEGENIEAFIEGINRNQSINSLHIGTDLRGVSFRNLRPFFRNNNNLYQLEFNFEVGLECAESIAFVLDENRCQSLESLRFEDCNLGEDGFAVIATALRTYPELEELHLQHNNIGLMGCTALADTLRGWEASNLKHLDLDGNGIDDQGLQTLAAGITNTKLEELHLQHNNIGLMGCTALADTLRGWEASNLKHLDLDGNGIDDQGLQTLAAGITNTKLEELYLSDNLITGAGLRSMSDYFQSESCCLKTLNVLRNDFGDEGAVALADILMGNKSLTSLHFISHQSGITNPGWAAFSKLLCDPSSINSTYLSNHNIGTIGEHEMLGTPFNIRRYLDLNELLDRRHAAIHKILKSHPDLDMEPFFQWKLKLLPAVINWFQSARSRMVANDLIGESIQRQRQSLPSRELSALYKFVRGMPALTVISYWQQQVINIHARRRRLDVEEETAWVRLGGRPRDEGNVEFIQIGAKRMRQE